MLGLPIQFARMSIGRAVPAISPDFCTLVDCVTRYPKAIHLLSTTAEVVAKALLYTFTREGFSADVLCDNGPQFVSNVMNEVARLMSIHQVHSTISIYHHMANGLVKKVQTALRRRC